MSAFHCIFFCRRHVYTHYFWFRLCIGARMIVAGLIAGGSGILIAVFYPTVVDTFLTSLPRALAERLKAMLEAPPHPEDDLLLTCGLISLLRAGISLDAALDKLAEEHPPASPFRARIRKIQLGNAQGNDFLSSFLHNALVIGSPALAGLLAFEKALQAKRRLHLKARGITGQCRAQAEVLSWLPWLLALAIFVIDPHWFIKAARSPLAWALWAMAVGLGGLGRQWIRRSLRLALEPRSEIERMEEEKLPDFLLSLLSGISQGFDVETAVDRALSALRCSRFSSLYLSPAAGGNIASIRATLRRAAATGAPLREELLSFIEGMQGEAESRWEERVQRLPVSLLLPLFVCFFPSSLLVLAGLLIPLLREAL